MSKLLAKLLNAQEPLFSQAIAELEALTNKPAEDILLAQEIAKVGKEKLQSFGFDPTDTAGVELYQALQNKLEQDNLQVALKLGKDDPDDVMALLPPIVEILSATNMQKTAWVIKKSVAKKLLQAMPPKIIMKQLGYRSVASMLKKENILELYGALRFVESEEWLEAFVHSYKNLQPKDFEVRPIAFVIMPHERWQIFSNKFIAKRKHNITHLKEMGIVVLLPLPNGRMRGAALTVLPLILHYMNEIRIHTSLFKLKQVEAGLGERIVTTILDDPPHAAVTRRHHIHWRVLYHHYGSLPVGRQPELFEPHVTLDDLLWEKIEDTLCTLIPELEWWRHLGYVGLPASDGPVSLSLLDAAANYTQQLPYASRQTLHFQSALWNELFMRYMGHEVLEKRVLRQLHGDDIDPEMLIGI